MLRKFSLWIALFIVIIPLAYAAGFLNPIKPDDLGEKSRGLYNLLAMIVGCEMDNKCMQVTLREIIQSDPHPIYEDYLKKLNQHKDDIEYEQMHCTAPELKELRRQLSFCLATMLNEIDPKVGLNESQKQSHVKELNQCIAKKMEKLSAAGNLYAMSSLMNRALKEKNFMLFERWYNRMQLEHTKIHFADYRECQAPLEMFDVLD